MIKILLVEDEIDLNRSVSSFLIRNGYEVTSKYDGEEALDFIESNNVDLVISDIMMPKMDGYTLSKEIRTFNKAIPIIFMTAKDDFNSKRKGFELGIDDYLVKPIDNEELLLHINAILRRAKLEEKKKIEIGNLVMDKEEHTCYINGEDINLTVREFDILYHMLSYPKKTFSRSLLMDLFWDYDSSATSRTVDVYMAKLREKTSQCDKFNIVTVHGLGYKVILSE